MAQHDAEAAHGFCLSAEVLESNAKEDKFPVVGGGLKW